MKALSALLIAVLTMHLVCGAQCMAPVKVEKPCHEQADTPPTTPQPDESNSRCNQGSVIEARTTTQGKHVLLSAFAVTPVMAPAVSLERSFMPTPAFETPPIVSTSDSFSILRI